MRKVSLLVVSIMMAFALAFSLVGCGNADEKAIRDGLTQVYNLQKDPKSDFWQKEIKKSLKDYESFGINLNDVIDVWAKDFSFKIGTIKVDGNKATAEITVTCKQLNPAVAAATNRLMSEDLYGSGMTDEQVLKKYNEYIIDELSKAKPVTTVVIIPCIKTEKTWSEADGATDEYFIPLFGPDLKR